jgi:hypothetical protein
MKTILISACAALFCLACHATTGVSRLPGTVIAWGKNDKGQSTVPNGLTHVTLIAAGGDHTVALRTDGTVIAWGNPEATQVPSFPTKVKWIDAGINFSLAVLDDGRVVGWGRAGPARQIPANLGNVVAVACREDGAAALRSDGTVVAWGGEAGNKINDVPIGYNKNIKAIAGSAYRLLALKEDGTVVGWGRDQSGETIPPPGVTSAVAIAAGTVHSLILLRDGSVIAWGWNRFGQGSVLPELNDVITVSSGFAHNLALKANGTVVAWGDNTYGQTIVPPGSSGVTAIAAGHEHSVAIQAHDPLLARQATAIANVSNGKVVSVTITDSGSGYVTIPGLRFNGGDGNGAAGTAVLTDSMVTSIEIVNSGSGYTTAPVVVIDPPPNGPRLNIKVSRVQVELILQVGRNYLLESSHDLKAWGPLGDPFTAQSQRVVQEFEVSDTGHFYRIKEVP